MSAPPPRLLSSQSLSMESGSNTENSARPGEQDRSSKSIQTSCAGTEPYYRVPILQRVLSPAPGYSSALYSVQVMTQSEVDTMKSHQRSSYQVLEQNSHSHLYESTDKTFTDGMNLIKSLDRKHVLINHPRNQGTCFIIFFFFFFSFIFHFPN